MTASGQVQPATMLWTEGLADWTQAVQIEGLFAAAPAPVAAPAPAPAANPYAASPLNPTAQGGNYPIPYVKKTSFGLYLTALLLPVLIGIIGFSIIAAIASKDTSDSETRSELNQQHANAGTPQELIDAEERLKEAQQPEYTDAEVGGGLAIILVVVLCALSSLFAAIYAYIILYRAWFCLQPGGARTTPGAAVGFLFVPLYNFYWIFVAFGGWAKDWNRIRASYPNLRSTPAASEGLFMTGLISMVTIIGTPIAMICFIIMHKQMCDAINSMVSIRNAAAMSKPGTLPSFY